MQSNPVKRLALVLIASLLVLTQPSIVSAATDNTDSNSYRTRNNIIFYNPNDTGAQQTCGGDGTLVGGTNLQKIFNYFVSKGLSQVEAAGAIGNIDTESGGDPTLAQGGIPKNTNDSLPEAQWVIDDKHVKDPSVYGTGVGVGKAWGIIQWDAGGRVLDYAKQANATGAIYRLGTQLEIVWWHMNNTSPTSRQNMMSGYNFDGEDQLLAAVTYYHDTMEGSRDANMANRLAKAKNALRQYGSGATTSTPVDTTNPAASISTSGTSSATTNCNGAAAGDAVKTAVGYAWPEYHAPPYFTMTASYATAVKKAQSEGRYVGGGAHPGIDCGGFVTLVMQDSKVDPNYNEKNGNTVAQRQYMLDHPEKYQLIYPTDTSGVQPGDIAVNSDHTYIYVGKVNGFATEIASASISFSGRSWRAPMAGHEIPGDPRYSWFRPLKAITP